jgi:hypothetical protein
VDSEEGEGSDGGGVLKLGLGCKERKERYHGHNNHDHDLYHNLLALVDNSVDCCCHIDDCHFHDYYFLQINRKQFKQW